MKTKILIYTICIFVLVLIQTTILDYIRIYDIKPNLLIVFVIAVALLRGNIEGSVVGFIIGLSQDFMSGKIIGFYALLGLYLGLILGSVNKRLYRENFLVVIFFTFTSTVAYEGLVLFLSTFLRKDIDWIFSLQKIIIPEAIYNSIASILIFIIVIRLSYRFESESKAARKY